MHSSLLVVDWDYFFPNPVEANDSALGDFELFDWGHLESRFMIEMIWTSRAAGFLANGLKLPTVEPSWKTFSSRFNLHPDATVFVADSNAHAGNLSDQDGDPFADVWLFDAHHDCGYKPGSFSEWMANAVTEDGRISYSCEDWMLIHHMQGSHLHWRWPTWHTRMNKVAEEGLNLRALWTDGIPVDAERDSLARFDEPVFDTVMICRSGAWVPPWCDGYFSQFLFTWDRDIEQTDEFNLDREWDPSGSQALADQIKARSLRA